MPDRAGAPLHLLFAGAGPSWSQRVRWSELVPFAGSAPVDRDMPGRARAAPGTGFARIFGYFRAVAIKAVAAIGAAARAPTTAAMMIPAPMLKSAARQFGAQPLAALAALAESIEPGARRCVERHDAPDAAIADVAQRGPLLHQTLAWRQYEAVPPGRRQAKR